MMSRSPRLLWCGLTACLLAVVSAAWPSPPPSLATSVELARHKSGKARLSPSSKGGRPCRCPRLFKRGMMPSQDDDRALRRGLADEKTSPLSLGAGAAGAVRTRVSAANRDPPHAPVYLVLLTLLR
jgi:hypothetical protein